MKKLRLGIIGGGPGSWIGHVHRIASRFDDKYEIVAGVFSRNFKIKLEPINPAPPVTIIIGKTL